VNDPCTFADACDKKCAPYADDGGSTWNNTKCVDVAEDPAQVGEPCVAEEFGLVCDPGLYCISPENAAECDQARQGCCQPFCDVTKMNTCAGAGQPCVAWYEQGTAPEGYEKVGICAIAP
jgi:hypothetical protein